MTDPNIRCTAVPRMALFDPMGRVDANNSDLALKSLLLTDTLVVGGTVTVPATLTAYVSALDGNLNVAVCNTMVIDTGDSVAFSNANWVVGAGELIKLMSPEIELNGNLTLTSSETQINGNLLLCNGYLQVAELRPCGNTINVNGNISINGGNISGGNLSVNSITVSGAISGNTLNIVNNAVIGGNTTTNNITVNNNIVGGNNLTVNNSIVAGNNLTVNNNITGGNNLTITNTITGGANLVVVGGGSFGGNLSSNSIVVNNAISGNSLTINGNGSFGGSTNVGGSLNVGGNVSGNNLSINNNVSGNNLTVNGNGSFGDSITVVNNISGDNLNVTNNTTTNNLTVVNLIDGNDATFNGTVNAGALNISGNTSTGNLVVNNNVTGGGSLIINGNGSFGGDVTVNNITVNHNTVTDNLVVNNNISANGIVLNTFTANVITGNTLIINNNASVGGDLNLVGNVVGGNNLTVVGNGSFGSNLSANNLVVNNGTTTNTLIVNLNIVGGNLTVNSNTVTGNLRINNTTTTNNLVVNVNTVTNNLTVNNNIAGGNLVINTNTVTNNLRVNNNILGGNLVINNDTTTNNLTVNNNILGGNLIISNTTTTDNLAVNSNATVGNNLTIAGSTVTNNLTVNNNLIATNANFTTLTVNGATISGNNSGDVTLAVVGATPNPNAATLTGQVLSLQPANGTNPGVVTTLAQTFAGNKTFTGLVSAAAYNITMSNISTNIATDFGIYNSNSGTNYAFSSLRKGRNIQLSFQTPGAGTSILQVDEVEFSWRSVADFGALGDGVSDDAVAIQDCINTVSTIGGGTVVLPSTSANAYLIGTTLTLPAGVKLLGGRKNVSITPSTVGLIAVDVAGGNVELQNLTFRNPTALSAVPRTAAFVTLSANGTMFRFCTFSSAGVFVNDVGGPLLGGYTFQNCTFRCANVHAFEWTVSQAQFNVEFQSCFIATVNTAPLNATPPKPFIANTLGWAPNDYMYVVGTDRVYRVVSGSGDCGPTAPNTEDLDNDFVLGATTLTLRYWGLRTTRFLDISSSGGVLGGLDIYDTGASLPISVEATNIRFENNNFTAGVFGVDLLAFTQYPIFHYFYGRTADVHIAHCFYEAVVDHAIWFENDTGVLNQEMRKIKIDANTMSSMSYSAIVVHSGDFTGFPLMMFTFTNNTILNFGTGNTFNSYGIVVWGADVNAPPDHFTATGNVILREPLVAPLFPLTAGSRGIAFVQDIGDASTVAQTASLASEVMLTSNTLFLAQGLIAPVGANVINANNIV